MRQRIRPREHFRRGNAATILIRRATQAAQSRSRRARQQDGPGGMGADGARGGVPAFGRRHRSGCGMNRLIRSRLKRHVTIAEWNHAPSSIGETP